MQELNIAPRSIVNDNMNYTPPPTIDPAAHQAQYLAARRKAMACLQKTIYDNLLNLYGSDRLPQTPTPSYPTAGAFFPERICRSRWDHHFRFDPEYGTPQDINKWMANCQALANKVPPRVHATVIRLGYNGWPTAARTGDRAARCLICGQGPDTLSHLARCPPCIDFLSDITDTRPFTPRHFFLTRWRNSPSHVVLAAIGLHALYDLRNQIKHGSPLSADISKQLWEHAKSAVIGSKHASDIMINRLARRNM